ncbi:PREDICTED: disintegrin and metalloproteinase domain-containing protein 19-like [Priapulus caudatus]|uniref:Disintegrin and metalloproteinase domain-containing protein 19-like n=1 Tax=Priapulus caudatus TaxID=37621 RepID=A0ABM1F9E5_PRICU|nr:PREDICTED: disintegrin and metalloproteinase domain-containing protein 19-like [Priapulus caudatus]
MGHVMGMDHDQILDGRGENCDCDDNTCIMSAVSTGSAPFVRWSRCSEKQLRDNYAREQDACLRERPDSLYMSPVCGNGFLEEGEKCDCGIVELCTNPCCNATTCQLQPHAECGAGSCCDLHTCQLRPASVVCRPARRSCDLAEYCTGSSELWELCVNAGEAYCYEGECYSHQSQCRRLWGESHHNGDVECYDRNVNGAESGNCGQDRILNEFTACSDDDKMCGVLFCTEHGHSLSDSLPETLVGFPSLVRKSRIQMGAQRTTCLWANIDFGLIVRNYGHVPNGAKCGEDKMCVNHKWRLSGQVLQSERTEQLSPRARRDGARQWVEFLQLLCFLLRQEGLVFDTEALMLVCNNVGNCHCFDGYAPPYCQKPGAGGSPDSGPALDDKGSLTVLIAFLVLFLVVIPAILISMAIYYIKFGLPSWIPLLGKGSALGRNQPNIKPEETRKSSSWRNKMPKFGNIRDTSSPQVPSQQQVETPARPLPHTPSPRQVYKCLPRGA